MSTKSGADHKVHRFQVHLGGMIDLLSNHLYSTPQVFVRELLQNATDAISARQKTEKRHEGAVEFEILPAEGGHGATLAVRDNGVGLTEDEIHAFLSTIGQSSKREDLDLQRGTYIGQFGIGLLSCFMVSARIVVITRSVKDGSRAFRWCGEADGTYTLKAASRDISAGTTVFLTPRSGFEEWFQPESIRKALRDYGLLLTYPILLRKGRGSVRINPESPPWRKAGRWHQPSRTECLEFGRQVFGEEFFDAIPLRCPAGKIEGLAFVLGHEAPIGTRVRHKVYLKGMFLTEEAKHLLPDWAFFVCCAIHSNALRPTASREGLYEDDTLDAAREGLGQCLQEYLTDLARTNPARMQQLIQIHLMAIKALAKENEELLRVFFDFLPFETSRGHVLGREIRQEPGPILFVPRVDRFRQIAPVAASQSALVVNAGYSYDQELLEMLPTVYPDLEVRELDVEELAGGFEDLTLDESEAADAFLQAAQEAMGPFQVELSLRRFRPSEIPVLYVQNQAADFLRSVDRAKGVSNDLLSGVLDGVVGEAADAARSQMCLNFDNFLVRRIAALPAGDTLRQAVQMLYVQALLLGQYPLGRREMSLLNRGLLSLIELSLPPSPQPPGVSHGPPE